MRIKTAARPVCDRAIVGDSLYGARLVIYRAIIARFPPGPERERLQCLRTLKLSKYHQYPQHYFPRTSNPSAQSVPEIGHVAAISRRRMDPASDHQSPHRQHSE